MVIVIAGSSLHRCPASTSELCSLYPSLVEGAKEFTTQDTRAVEEGHCLYVAQGEFAVVPGNDTRIRFVGSDDATTCHIITLRHRASGTVALAHFDGHRSEERAVRAMVDKIGHLDGGIEEGLELRVVGGYIPEKGSTEAAKNESEHLSLKILRLFMNHRCSFTLELWCTCHLNTTTITDTTATTTATSTSDTSNPSTSLHPAHTPRPTVYGVGVDMSTGSVYPAHFKSREPNLPLRSAARWMGDDGGGPHDLYNHHSGTITIQPFTYSGVEWFAMYLRLPDEALLRNFSTSPKVEPPQFCDDLRRVFTILVDHPNPRQTLFPNGTPKKYIMSERGMWELVQDE